MSLRPSAALSIFSALLFLSTERSALADDVSGLEGLLSEQIVSSASKQAEGASSAPALSTNLTAEDLRRYGIRTLAEAIDFLAIAVSSSENLNGAEVGARGILLTGDRGSHFLLLVDGHVLNDPLNGGTSFGVGAGIPLELVDHIEVIVGPGSVLYGSNAMFGVVNVVTKRPKDYAGVRVLVESTLLTSIRAAAGVGTTFRLFGEAGELTTEFEYFKQSGPDLFFDAENTGIDRFTGQPGRNSRDGGPTGIWGGRRAARALYAEAPAGLLRATLGNTELLLQGNFYRHAAPTGPGDFDDPDTVDRETRLIAGLKHRLVVSTLLDVSARAYASFYDSSRDFIASRGVLCPFGIVTCDYHDTGHARFLGVELQSGWDWFRDGRFFTVFGADARARKVTTSSDTFDTQTRASFYPAAPGLDRADVTLAAFAQQTWQVTRALIASAGARIDADPRFSPVVSPRVALSWQAGAGATFKMSYSGAFRAPSWNEANNSDARRILADGLEPEKVRSIEGTAQQSVGSHRLVLGGFYSRWSNLVELAALSDQQTIDAIRNERTTVPFTPGVQLTQYRNTTDITNYGMNAGVEGSFALERILYGFSVTGAVAERRTSEGTGRLPVAPRLFGNARVGFVLGDGLPTVACALHLLGPRPADLSDGQFRPTPYARTQVELRLTLTGVVPWLSGLSYRLIGNYDAAARGPYVVGPVTSAIPTQTTPQLIPVDRFRLSAGLQYEF